MTRAFDPAPAAALLAQAMTSGKRIAEIPEQARPQTIDDGYAVQDRIAGTSGHPLGETPAGWKLGLGSANAMKGANLSAPLIGRVFEERLHKTGAVVAAPAGATALIEIEVAFTLSRDVPPSETVANPLDVVASANLVSEIVLSRFVDRRVVGLPSFAADSVGFHALVVGPVVDPARIGAMARSMAVTLDGKPTVEGLTGDDSIDPIAMLAALMAHARHRGITLRKGEIVTTGTLSKPFDAAIPCTVEATTEAGAVSFSLKAIQAT